ncbi:MAG: hypothetical protein C7B45_03450 [Sulfobacillus acidophilus]|uniref:Uncharacterized protein n=1 Tax=Sulfobacillus acidophilus TaxID=53633 RepID=A0A2T2WMB1_9FIRM|nr:MAG: hypothetical protein C7B45_03450 [Sulfobacillus acidophilus]
MDKSGGYLGRISKGRTRLAILGLGAALSLIAVGPATVFAAGSVSTAGGTGGTTGTGLSGASSAAQLPAASVS